MSTIRNELRQLRLLASQGVQRQAPKSGNRNNEEEDFLTVLFYGFVLAAMIGVVYIAIDSMGLQTPFKQAWPTALWVAGLSACVLWLKPYLLILLDAVLRWKLPVWTDLVNKYTAAERGAAYFAIAVLITAFADWSYPTFRYMVSNNLGSLFQYWPSAANGLASTFNIEYSDAAGYHLLHPDAFMSWFSVVMWLFLSFIGASLYSGSLVRYAKLASQQVNTSEGLPFSLWLGRSTGLLVRRGHKAGLKPGQQVGLNLSNACQNIITFGGIGSGKTSTVIHPLLIQLFDQHCGGLIFDVKGDFHEAVRGTAVMTQRSYKVIGPGFASINLLDGLKPALAATFLKSGLLLSDTQIDRFWLDTASELCRNALGLLYHIPEHYTLKGLYEYLFVDEFRIAVIGVIDSLIDRLDEQEKRALMANKNYTTGVFQKFDDKVRNGVHATCAQILAPFSQIELTDAFCKTDGEHLPWHSLLDGNIFLVQLPTAQWGLGAKLAYTFLKLRFFNLMQQRALNNNWNQETPVFFLCDEYQDVISANKDGLSDLNFWDKSRDSKTIGIVSSQAVSSFYAAIGDHDVANSILQNFRQKLCFSTEDEATIKYFQFLAGDAEIPQTSRAKASHKGGTANTQKSRTVTETVSPQSKPVIDSQLFRSLTDGQVIAMLNLANGLSADDILLTKYVAFD